MNIVAQKNQRFLYSQRSLISIDSDANKTSTDYFCDLRVNHTQDPNHFWDLPKNDISRRSFMKIFTRSHSSEDLRWISSENLVKIFRRKDFIEILIKTFSSKNLQKIYINFLRNNFLTFLPKIFLRSSKDLLVFFLIFIFKKI